MSADAYYVDRAQWPAELAAIRAVRDRVFIEEQQVPRELEVDGADPACVHVLARDPARNPIGTGRLAPDGKIGRLAVLPPWRGRGIGGALLSALVREARSLGLAECRLHAQSTALAFYTRHGFTAEGPVFMEAGIAHRLMRMPLRATG